MTETAPGAGPRYDVNLSILFTELDLLQRPAAAARAGFDAVEYWWPFDVAVPGDRAVDRFVGAVADAGVRLVGLNFFAGDMPGGERGLVSLPARSSEFLDNLDVAVGVAERLGCTSFNALYGNRVEGVPGERQDDVAVGNLAAAAEAAGRIGGTVLVEPVSGPQPYPLRTAADALAVLDRVESETGASNLALLADLYHLHVNGDDVDLVIARHTGRIGHVQVADAPGRHEPGTGTLDIDGYLGKLALNGYRGYVGLEYQASGSTVDSFAWLPEARRSTVSGGTA